MAHQAATPTNSPCLPINPMPWTSVRTSFRQAPSAFGKYPRGLAGKCQQRFVELGQVRVEPIVARSPACRSLITSDVEHCEIVCRLLLVAELRELIADIGGGVLADNALTQ